MKIKRVHARSDSKEVCLCETPACAGAEAIAGYNIQCLTFPATLVHCDCWGPG